MSVLAASVCQRGGDVLLSRQFAELSCARVHEILGFFPQLLKDSTQHTTLEENGCMYICEPLDELFVVIVSDAETANIIQDLKTLRVLSELVKQTAAPNAATVNSKDVIDATFAIMDAFDEVITMGYSENVSPSQVQSFLKMESYEERIQQIIEHNKQLEAAEQRLKRSKELEAERNAEKMRHSPFGSSSSNFGSSSSNFGSTSNFGSLSNIGCGSIGDSSAAIQPVSPSAPKSFLKGKGLQLGRKGGEAKAPLLGNVSEVGSMLPTPTVSATQLKKPETTGNVGLTSRAASHEPTAALSTTTDISIAEQLTVEMLRDGSVKQSRVSGTLQVFAGDREHSKLRIATTTGGSPSNYKPHPKFDRTLFSSERVLGLKNSQEELPASNVLLVKWTVDKVPVPLIISCWVNQATDRGFLNVTVEYEVAEGFEGTLEKIVVSVLLPTSNAHGADPTQTFEQFDDRIVWTIPQISAEKPSDSFEFTAEATDENDFYPIEVSFEMAEQSGPGSLTTFGKIDVDKVTDPTGEVEFTKTAVAKTASYVIR